MAGTGLEVFLNWQSNRDYKRQVTAGEEKTVIDIFIYKF